MLSNQTEKQAENLGNRKKSASDKIKDWKCGSTASTFLKVFF